VIIPPGLDVATTLGLVACSALTSLLTASLGAGGGVLLLLLLALFLPPAVIIPVHGLIQLGSNGGRAALTWRHIDWRLMRAFAPGVVLGVVAGALLLGTVSDQRFTRLLNIVLTVLALRLLWLASAALLAQGDGLPGSVSPQ